MLYYYSMKDAMDLMHCCALGKGKVDVERPVISYIIIITGRLYIGIYRQRQPAAQ